MSDKNHSQKKCVVCELNRASFFAVVIVGTLARSPKSRLNTKTIPLCDSCCNPKAGKWEEFKRKVCFALWDVRGMLIKKLEDAQVAPGVYMGDWSE